MELVPPRVQADSPKYIQLRCFHNIYKMVQTRLHVLTTPEEAFLRKHVQQALPLTR